MEQGKDCDISLLLHLLPSSLLLIYFTSMLLYTYPWTEEIEMNQTGPLLVWKQTRKQTVAIYIKCH